jgi:hypothetical protein
MQRCTRHRHSSQETARRCWEKQLGQRADRRMRVLAEVFRSGLTEGRREQDAYAPPLAETRGGLTLWWFFRGRS